MSILSLDQHQCESLSSGFLRACLSETTQPLINVQTRLTRPLWKMGCGRLLRAEALEAMVWLGPVSLYFLLPAVPTCSLPLDPCCPSLCATLAAGMAVSGRLAQAWQGLQAMMEDR